MNSTDTFTDLRDLAVRIAVAAAGRISDKRLELGDVRRHYTTKSSAVDPVTVVDTLAEDFIVDQLESARAGDGIIGEEGSEQPSLTGVSWVIDPIDGTVNFLYGIPHYAVSIAAAIDGRVVAGAVVNVGDGTVYAAAERQGATVTREGRETELACNLLTDPAQALVATGFSYSATRRRAQAMLLTDVLPQVRDIRRMGAAALGGVTKVVSASTGLPSAARSPRSAPLICHNASRTHDAASAGQYRVPPSSGVGRRWRQRSGADRLPSPVADGGRSGLSAERSSL